jgi:histone H3/H4
MTDTKPANRHRLGFSADINNIMNSVIRELPDVYKDMKIRKGDDAKIQLATIAQQLTRRIYNRMIESVRNSGRETVIKSIAIAAVSEVAGLSFMNQLTPKLDKILDMLANSPSNTPTSSPPAPFGPKGGRAEAEPNISRKRVALTTRLGILVNPSHVRLYLKSIQKMDGVRLSTVATVVVAAFLDSLIQMTIKSAIEAIISTGKATIQPRHLLLGINLNPLLYEIYTLNKVYFLGAGVVPFMSSLLDEDEKRKKQNKKRRVKAHRMVDRVEGEDEAGENGVQESNVARSRRRLPGTITKINIKKAQDNVDLIVQTTPFTGMVRAILAKINPTRKYRVSPDAIYILQSYAEQRVILLMREALFYTSVAKNTISLNPALLVEIAATNGILRKDGVGGRVILPNLLLSAKNTTFIKTATISRLAMSAGWSRTLKNVPTEQRPNPIGPTLSHAVGSIFEEIITEIVHIASQDMLVHKQTKLSSKCVLDATFAIGVVISAHTTKKKN